MGHLISPCHSPAFISGRTGWLRQTTKKQNTEIKIKLYVQFLSEMNILNQNDAKLNAKRVHQLEKVREDLFTLVLNKHQVTCTRTGLLIIS